MTEEAEWGEPVTGGDIHDLDKEGPLVGTYVGYREIHGDYGVSKLHEFNTETGKKAIWGKAHADRLLDGRNGELVKIELTGERVNLGGGRSMVEYRLFSKGRVNSTLESTQGPLPAPESASNGGGASQDAPFPSAS